MTEDDLREAILPLTKDVWWLEFVQWRDGGISSSEVAAFETAVAKLEQLANEYGRERVEVIHWQIYATLNDDPSLVDHVVVPDTRLNDADSLMNYLLARKPN
jgi:hypothetical protein